MSDSETVPVVDAHTAQSFARQNFGGINLGHKLRNRAALKTAERICRHPGGTLPTKLASPAAYKSMDLLMNRPETTHARMLAPHYALTKEKMAAAARQGPVLILHDTTELDYSGLSIADLGPIGNGGGRGYLCHNSLAMLPGGQDGGREVLGLAHQILHCREAVGKKEGVKAKRERPGRESRLWSRAVEALGPGAEGGKVIDVADAGADLFEFLATEQKLDRRCLVRACKDRSIVIGHEAIKPGRGKNKWPGKKGLYKHLRSLASMGGQKTKDVREPGTAEARTATLSVACAAVQLLPPHVRRGEYEEKPLKVWVLRVWEENPPAGTEALEWFLVTFEPVTTATHAWEVSSWYACRYVVEEYHKGLKTGCAIEDMQFETSQPLKPMIALLSVVAVMLLNLREAARRPDADERPATEVVDETYEEVLRGWRFQKNPPAEPFTIKGFYMALARLGGHMNRRSDGFPGWLTLWRGWMKLHSMVEGAEAQRRIRKNVG
jgi:hypothetical protein